MKNQGFIQRAKLEIFGFQKKRAIARRRAKLDRETLHRELELLIDDLQAEGVDVGTPAGMAVAIRTILLKHPGEGGEYRSAMEEEWPEGL